MQCHRSVRVFTLTLFILLACGVSTAQADEQDESYWRLDFDTAFFTGDFGAGEDSKIDFSALTTRLRYRQKRAEFRLSAPLLRLSGDARLIGGTPIGNGDPPGPIPTPSPETTVSGLGDMSLRLDYDLLVGSYQKPWLTLLTKVKFPTGDETKGLGTGELDYEAGLLFAQPVGRGMLLLDGRYNILGEPEGVAFENVTTLSGGISVALGESRRSSVYSFYEHRSHPVGGLDARESITLGLTGSSGKTKSFKWTVAAFTGLSDTAEDWGAQLAFARVFK